jgi:hypothetical protein
MKTKLLAQTGWRGQLNDRVLSAAFRTLEDAHSLPLIPIAVLSATFDGRLPFSALSAAALAQPTDKPSDHEYGRRDDQADAGEHIGENNSGAVVNGHDARGRIASMPL